MRNFVIITIIMIFAITLSADWSIEQKVFAENGAGEDYFGKSVSISGDYAIVGSSANTAYLYKKINEDWLEEQIIQPPDSISTIHFGSTVFINGDYLLICDNHDYNYSSGTVFIYYNEDDNWILMDTITASGSPECDQYACSAGITEDGEYKFTVNPQELRYTISPAVVCLNNLDRIQVNGSILGEPWNPKAKEHEMARGEDGIWRKKVELYKNGGEAGNGIYVMNFSIDSEWFLDGTGMGGAWGKTWHILPQESNIMFQVLKDGEYEIRLDTVKNSFSIFPEVKPITKFYSLRIVGNFEEFENDGSGGWSPFQALHDMQTSDGVTFSRDLRLIQGKAYQYKYTANNAGWGWVFNDYPWDGYRKLALHGNMAPFEFKPDTTGIYRFSANVVTGEYLVKKIE